MNLDGYVTRDSFWVIIANRFNDPFVSAFKNFDGRVDNINANEMPVKERSASTLSKHFYESKKAFTKALQKWSQSGQKDPGRFTSFLVYNENGELTANSKRSFILFTVCKCDTPYSDENFINLA